MCLRLLLAGGSLALLLGMVACGQKGAATSVTSEGDNRVRLPARSDYTKFDPWLQKLLAKIDIVDDERKRFMRAYKAFEKDLVGVLRTEEPLFKLTFSRVHPTGSSFEGLRISSPNEFDMNAVLNLPLENKGDIQVREDEAAGHLTLTLLKSATDYFGETWFTNYIKQKGESFKINDIRKTLIKLWNGKNLSRENVLRWMQSAADRTLVKLKNNKDLELWAVIKSISRRRAGPAITFDVCTKAGEYLSVDFVPALSFQEDVLTKEMRKRVKEISRKKREWYVIPKGPPESAAKVWRASLWDHERDYISGLEHFKPLVRLLKKLRDEQNWTGLASYYIKTSAMLIVEDMKSEGRSYFKRSIGVLLMRGLKQLKELTNACKLPFFWDKKNNLLANMNESTCMNISKRLNIVSKSFEKSLTDDSEDPMIYFGTSKDGLKQRNTRNAAGGVCVI
ncbi:cyclic GMP-AMP synthase-like receptor [Frankliniella occidentalis]|uniref:Cyclic GMP-AMP synthase-like receptor n=1 Tax=Frankliniella occidentalis TaxID=133901 RepID=A0A9C6X667_FRAOC|nr:cyclic GMP-AMP synthase-like receptor [Frankliniella occidentalis]